MFLKKGLEHHVLLFVDPSQTHFNDQNHLHFGAW